MTGFSNDDESDVEGEREDIMENEKKGKLNELPVDKVSSIQEESPPVTITVSPPNEKKVINEPIIEEISEKETLLEEATPIKAKIEPRIEIDVKSGE